MEQFLIPAGDGTSEYMEKKSRFLGLITPVTTEAEARARLEAVKKQEYDARHNCWAYILHSGQKRYSDDGEPQGTAGQPILNVLEREGVQDVLCVVTRYFGGILLGAGGLCRSHLHGSRAGHSGAVGRAVSGVGAGCSGAPCPAMGAAAAGAAARGAPRSTQRTPERKKNRKKSEKELAKPAPCVV